MAGTSALLAHAGDSSPLLDAFDVQSASCCPVEIHDAARQVGWRAGSGSGFPLRSFPSCMIAVGARIEIRIPTETRMIYAPSNREPGRIVPDDPDESAPFLIESASAGALLTRMVLRTNAADAEYRCFAGQDCTCNEEAAAP